MNELDLLVSIGRKLCDRLEKMASDERQFGFEMCAQLDKVSYDIGTNLNNIEAIKNYFGG